jgi:hypothetical protein
VLLCCAQGLLQEAAVDARMQVERDAELVRRSRLEKLLPVRQPALSVYRV